MVRLLLDNGAPVNAMTHSGYTPLHRAAEACFAEGVKMLLAHNADITVTDIFGLTPLRVLFVETPYPEFYVIERSRQEGVACVLLLLNAGADWRFLDSRGNTLLHIAIMQGYEDVVAFLLSQGAPVLALNDKGCIPLHMTYGSERMIGMLLQAGCSVDEPNQTQSGDTLLHTAVADGDLGLISFLLSKGAAVNAVNDHGETPLHLAVDEGEEVILKMLLKYGANPVAVDGLGITPLHRAAKHGSLDVIAFLARIPKVDINSKDSHGWTALDSAVSGNQPEAIRLLVRLGVARQVTKPKKNPLLWARNDDNEYALQCAVLSLITLFDLGRLSCAHYEQNGNKRIDTPLKTAFLLSQNANAKN